jgi:hypothetical protein
MAKLVYCSVCKATYPANVVQTDGSRGSKTRESTCPMGHADIAELTSPRKRRGAK